MRISMEMPQKEKKTNIKAGHSSEVEHEPRTHRTLGSVSSPFLKKKKSYKNRTTVGMLLLGINVNEMNSYQRCLLLRVCRGTIHKGSGKVPLINQKGGTPSFVETNKQKRLPWRTGVGKESTLETGKKEEER